MSAAASPDVLLNAISDWLFADDGIASQMEAFAMQNAIYVPYIANRSDYELAEHRLSDTTLFTQFQSVFEQALVDFVGKHGWTVDAFVELTAKEMENTESESSGAWKTVYEVLMSLTDFQVFRVMMFDARKKMVEEGGAQAS